VCRRLRTDDDVVGGPEKRLRYGFHAIRGKRQQQQQQLSGRSV